MIKQRRQLIEFCSPGVYKLVARPLIDNLTLIMQTMQFVMLLYDQRH